MINVKHHLSDTMSLSFVLDFTFEYFKVHVHSNIDALVYMHLLSNLCKNFTFVMHNCNVLLDLYLKVYKHIIIKEERKKNAKLINNFLKHI